MTTKMLGHDDLSSTESAASRGETLPRLADGSLDAGPQPTGGNADAGRAGYTRHQQAIAYRALSRGHVGAARLSLRVLRADDFDQVTAISEMYLAVLRDARASEEEVVTAAEALLRSPVRVR